MAKSQEYERQANQLAREYPQNALLYRTFDADAEKILQRGNQDSAVLFRRKSLTVFWATRRKTQPRTARPSLLVRIQPKPAGGLLVEVQDNGPGLPPPAPSGRSQSFGQRLIRELTGQLGGQVSLPNRQGTYFRLWIPA